MTRYAVPLAIAAVILAILAAPYLPHSSNGISTDPIQRINKAQ